MERIKLTIRFDVILHYWGKIEKIQSACSMTATHQILNLVSGKEKGKERKLCSSIFSKKAD
jgi:hypothetical protein